jgi:hypothetical protein
MSAASAYADAAANVHWAAGRHASTVRQHAAAKHPEHKVRRCSWHLRLPETGLAGSRVEQGCLLSEHTGYLPKGDASVNPLQHQVVRHHRSVLHTIAFHVSVP